MDNIDTNIFEDEHHNIKIVRLQNGYDIIADIEEYLDDSVLRLINPMIVVLKRTSVGTVLMMYPWLPVELIDENIAIIGMSDVLSFLSPKEQVVEYYQNMVNIQLVKWMEMNPFDKLTTVEDSLDEDTEFESDTEEQTTESNRILH